MPKIDRFTLLFSLNSFAAAMLALYVSFALGLPRPFWAMATAYIVSLPLAGAVRSKAVYRLLGTILGAAAAAAMVPNLVNAPALLCLGLALWVGGCLTISLLDRTPRSYLMMLAGYTAAVVGFPSVDQPGAIFDVAVARVVEIGLGIVCATLVHSLVFPRPVGATLQANLAAWLAEADRWALDLLKGDAAAAARDRSHLAAAASEIQALAVHLPFDTSPLRETTGVVRAVHERMLLLLPLLSGVSDRLAALRGARDPPVREALDAVAAWIEAGAPRARGLALTERLTTLARERADASWQALLVENLLERLAEAVAALGESHALMLWLRDPNAALSPHLAAVIAGTVPRRMHSDLPMALLSGAAAVIAILLTCALWILTGWGDGAAALIMTAVMSSFFATLDDPVPAIKTFGVFWLVSMPLAALYMFAALPGIDGLPLLVVSLAPPLLFLGLYFPDPKRMIPAQAVVIGFCSALALQPTFSADFANFLNGNLATFVGMFAAIIVTAGMRSMSADISARRLLGHTWKGLARLARAGSAPEPAAFAAVLVDRLGILTPKLSMTSDNYDQVGLDGLRDLRIGMNLVAVQAARTELAAPPRAVVDDALSGVADHFSALAAGRGYPPGPDLLRRLDAALGSVAGANSGAAGQGLSGLVGLRRNLFPDAPAFLPEPVA
jgi:uncharacterized membrane protein YccC